MNFDHVDPRVFWSVVLLVWFLVSLVVGLAVGRYFRWVDSHRPRNRYVQDDHVASRKRRLERNGFKSRIGAR